MRSSDFGIFDARGTVMEGNLMPARFNDIYHAIACLVLSFPQKPGAFTNAEILPRPDWTELVAPKEVEYYQKVSSFYAPIRWMTWISALLISIGAFMGTQYTFCCILFSIKEFGALQAMGFSRFSVFLVYFRNQCLRECFPQHFQSFSEYS